MNRIKKGGIEVRSLIPAAPVQSAPVQSAPVQLIPVQLIPVQSTPVQSILGKRAKLLGLLVTLLAIAGCESINVHRLAYDFLRQEDCRRNDVDVYEFCSRTFVFEYDEYEQLRQEYIRTEAEKFAREERNRTALQNAAWH